MATLSGVPAWRILMGRGAWGATVHGVTKSQTYLKKFSMQACKVTHTLIHLLRFMMHLAFRYPYPDHEISIRKSKAFTDICKILLGKGTSMLAGVTDGCLGEQTCLSDFLQ